MSERVQEIVDLVKHIGSNDFALWSRATHVIFEDKNIEREHLEYALHDETNKAYWLDGIRMLYDNTDTIEGFLDRLSEVIETRDALYKLTTYTDDELIEASNILG